ncbi:MAG: phosphodiesterase [Clostridiales bacterium]|jgi:phosphoesterase, MJ0936 family|nr:phosphodiesterase [Clostridiales bacterium]
MKLFIASDLHGSALWCARMLDAYRASGACRLVLLGDLLYHGPRNDLPEGYDPKAVIAMLNPLAREILAVRGNCEAEVDGMVLDFPVSADYGLIFDGERALYLSHGHREVPKMPAGSYYFTGHTHIPHDYVESGVRFLNPGSVAIPKNQTPHGAILYEDGEVRRIELSEKD